MMIYLFCILLSFKKSNLLCPEFSVKIVTICIFKKDVVILALFCMFCNVLIKLKKNFPSTFSVFVLHTLLCFCVEIEKYFFFSSFSFFELSPIRRNYCTMNVSGISLGNGKNLGKFITFARPLGGQVHSSYM